MPDSQNRTYRYARVNATADGVNVVIAPVPNKQIRVLGLALSANTAGTLTLQDSAGSPVIFGALKLPDSGGIVDSAEQIPAFETASGRGLNISNSAGLDVTGRITYVLV